MDKLSSHIVIRNDIQPGDIGAVIYLHGIVYKNEYNFDHTFERYVAEGLIEFIDGYDKKKDRLWIVEDRERIVGSILILGRSAEVAQLRYFILLPEYRGKGLGKGLMHEAVNFCKSTGYRSVFLWTTSELDTAARLYETHGFRKTGDKTRFIWGKEQTEVCYDLHF